MIIIVNNDEETRSVIEAMRVINTMRGPNTYPTRPNTEDSPWVRTVWPNENYL